MKFVTQKLPQNIASFTKYSRTIGMHTSLAMNHARTLLQERRRPKEERNSSNLPEPGHFVHVNRPELSDELLEAPIISRVGPSNKSV